MAILLRVMCWNVAEGSDDQHLPANAALPAIAEQVRAKAPDILLLNELKHWDGISGWMGGSVIQAQVLRDLTGMPYAHWTSTVQTGLTGHKAVAVLSRYPLGAAARYPILHGTEPTTYATLGTNFVADGRLHRVFTTRFDAHHEDDNVAAHQQSIDLVQSLGTGANILFGGDFNANLANDWQFRRFCQISGLTHTFQALPDPTPCIEDGNGQLVVDHIFFRGPYQVLQLEVRCPWAATAQQVSDHPWVFAELATHPGAFFSFYRSLTKLKHWMTGDILHSHAFNYGHPGTSGQQQVTAFAGADDNDFWRVKGPHGQPEDFGAGQAVQDGAIIRLEHVLTRRNLHSHAGAPSPVTGQQEVTCYGSNGVGDSNDNWRLEIEGGGSWASGKRVRLVHVNTNHALHSHAGYSHPQWTMGQQEVTAYADRDDNDWWYLFQT